MRVIETFEITGRGVVVLADETTDHSAGARLVATVRRPDGSTVNAEAFKERLLRYRPEAIENEAYLLRKLSKTDVPIGSEIYVEVDMPR